MKNIIEIDLVLKRACCAGILCFPIKFKDLFNFGGRLSTPKSIEFDTKKDAEQKRLGNFVFSILKGIVGPTWAHLGPSRRLSWLTLALFWPSESPSEAAKPSQEAQEGQPSRPRGPGEASRAVPGTVAHECPCQIIDIDIRPPSSSKPQQIKTSENQHFHFQKLQKLTESIETSLCSTPKT